MACAIGCTFSVFSSLSCSTKCTILSSCGVIVSSSASLRRSRASSETFSTSRRVSDMNRSPTMAIGLLLGRGGCFGVGRQLEGAGLYRLADRAGADALRADAHRLDRAIGRADL